MSTILPMDAASERDEKASERDEKAAYTKDDGDMESGSLNHHEHLNGLAIAVKEAETEPDKAYVRRFGRFGPYLEKLFASGVEARGVERVPEDQRETKNIWNK